MIPRFLFLLGARGFREVFQTAFLIYLARQNTATYGEFIFAIGLAGVLLVTSEFGLNQYLVPALSRGKGNGDRMITRITLVKAVLFALTWLGLWVFLRLGGYPPQLLRVVLVIAAGAGLEAVASTFYTALQFHGLQKQEAGIKSAAAAAGFGYGLAAAVLGAPAVAIALFKLIDSSIGTVTALLALSRGRVFRPARPTGTRRLIRPALVFGLIQITAILSNRINILFLERYGGAERVAFYGAPWQILDGVAGLFSVLFVQSVLYPAFTRTYRRDPNEAADLVRQTTKWLTLLALPLMFLLSVEGDRLIGLLYGADYASAVWIQRVLVLVILFSFFQNLGASLLMGMGLEKGLLVLYLAGLGIHTALCILLIPAAPLKGAVLTILAGKGGLALCLLWCCQRRLSFIQARPLMELVLASVFGLAVYLSLRTLMVREAVEILSLAPVILLAWKWRRSDGR